MDYSLSSGAEELWIGVVGGPSGPDVEDGILEPGEACRAVARCVNNPGAMSELRRVLFEVNSGALWHRVSDHEVLREIEGLLQRRNLRVGRRHSAEWWGTMTAPSQTEPPAARRDTPPPPAPRSTPSRPATPPSSAPAAPVAPAAPPTPAAPPLVLAVPGAPPVSADSLLGAVPLPPVVPAVPAVPGAPLSFYEVIVLDELETGIAGVEVELTTPNGTETLLTDGSGSVRVDNVPPGTGTAHIVSASQLFEVLKDRVESPKRSTPLPSDDTLLVLSPSGVVTNVSFPDAQPQRIMIVSRTDLVWSSVVEQWGDLQLLSPESDPARLAADELTSILRLGSTGAGPSALIGLPPSGVDTDSNTPTVDRAARLTIDIDTLHEALFASDFDGVSAILDKAAEEPPEPPPPPDFPTPSEEGVDFATELALLALGGDVDLTVIPEEQV